MPGCSKYRYQDHTGYLIHPDLASPGQGLVGLGHTAFVSPWADKGVHCHLESEELYLLLAGELQFLIQGIHLNLKPRELLLVRPGIEHAILGGQGRIEHFGMRVPARQDKQVTADLPVEDLPLSFITERELTGPWGYRIPLSDPKNQNCWLLGTGSALFESPLFCLAYLFFHTPSEANFDTFPPSINGQAPAGRQTLHYHHLGWEYYVVLQGAKIFQIEQDLVTVEAGEILEVPHRTPHKVIERKAPYEGFTFRVPLLRDDKVECEDPGQKTR